MKVSKEATLWYEKVNTVWKENGFPIRFSRNYKNENVDYAIAVKVLKGFWKKEMKTKFPYVVREGSGNRYTWVTQNTTLTVEKSRKALSIAPIKRNANKDKVQMRYEAMLVREKRWSSKLTKAKNGHAKVLKEIKRYRSIHKDRLQNN